MLNTDQIPQYQDRSESWDNFLYKAAKGSHKANDALMYADMAYMIALTGDPCSPDTLELTHFYEQLREHFSHFSRPESAGEIAASINSCNWFTIKLGKEISAPQDSSAYAALWSKGQTVCERQLLNDAVQKCHSSLSVDWLTKTIDEEKSMNYNSLNVVAAMLMLGLTWKND